MAGEETRAVISIILLLTAASLYVMGLSGGRSGRNFFIAGLAVHAGSMLWRASILGMPPITEKRDTISFMAFSMALLHLKTSPKTGETDISLLSLPMISIFTLIPLAYEPLDTITPFLRSPWFFLHVFTYFLSYSFFGISACFGAYYLWDGKPAGELLQYKTALLGWIVYSISLVLGSIWFYFAYGTYWLWTSKELWSALAWFVYAGYLHARLMKSFRGRPAAAFGALGFAAAVFAYFGVGTIIPSPPVQF